MGTISDLGHILPNFAQFLTFDLEKDDLDLFQGQIYESL